MCGIESGTRQWTSDQLLSEPRKVKTHALQWQTSGETAFY